MMKRVALASSLALAFAPALAQAGGEVVAPPSPAPAPVVTPAPAVQAPAPAPAPVAVDESGPYAALYGGASWLDDADIDAQGFGEGDLEFDTGWIVGGALGYAFDTGGIQPRAELDVAYRENDFDQVAFGASEPDVGGELSAISTLANVWVDIPVTENLKPYAGGGVGAAWLDTNDISVGGTGFDDAEDTVFAWQLGGGVAYEFTPNVAATVDYRWFNTDDPDFDGVEAEYSSHNVMGGLRYKF